jgi:bifunctional non-homologous end joining protein LigD
MLCHDVEVDGTILKECGMDGQAATAAYRKAIAAALAKLMIRGFACERKWDGTRVLAIGEDGTITLQNRHGVIYTIRLPEVVAALKHIPGRWVIDGEAVYMNPATEREEFTPCQRRCSTHFPDFMLREKYPIKLEVFDVLQLNGNSVEQAPYWKRKEALQQLLDGMDETVEFVRFEKDLQKAWKRTLREDLEGLIVKRFESPYEHNRSYSWLKVKNWQFESCNVVGYTAGQNSRSPFFGSLVIARDGKLRGCVGSGLNDWELRKIKDILTDSPPMENPFSHEQVGEPYKAVKTNLQVLVKYYLTTDSGVMRHPIFITSN